MTQVLQTKLNLEGLERKIYRISHSLNSTKTFNDSIKLFTKFLNEQELTLEKSFSIDPYQTLESFSEWMDKKGYRTKTQVVRLHYVERLYRHQGINLDRNKLKEEVILPKRQTFADAPLTPETARQILLEIKHKVLRLILCLMKDTVGRPAELLSLKLSHFNLTHDPPYLTIPGYAAKNDIEREVFFTQETKNMLISYLKSNKITKQSQHLFLKGDIDPIGNEIGFQEEVARAYRRISFIWKKNRESLALSDLFTKIEQRGVKTVYNIHIYSFKKFAFTKIADTVSEIAAHAIAGHEDYLITYYKKTREERANEYRKVIPKLQLFTKPSEIEDCRNEIEGEIGKLPPDALAQVLAFIKTANKDKKW